MTREYGNYEKYEEDRNSVKTVTEKGQNDYGSDKLLKKDNEMNMRLNTLEGEDAREREHSAIEEVLTNEQFADQTIRDRLSEMKQVFDNPDEV